MTLDTVFTVERPDRHYYLVTEGHWQDRQGCGVDQCRIGSGAAPRTVAADAGGRGYAGCARGYS
ncbi:MAG: hypothetical protein M3151_13350 [Actinomycetota bacterium]|nr:hypothetical protein [Actinomycetota bacterium]